MGTGYRQMPLTALGVKNAKPKAKPYKIADEKGPYLVVTPGGSKLWRFDYRYGEKRKTLRSANGTMSNWHRPGNGETPHGRSWLRVSTPVLRSPSNGRHPE